ncbi:MAG: phenylalanine--tRNA ligase subunit beta [Bdellovibrionota bacterium]
MKISWKWLFEIYDINPTAVEWRRVAELRSLLPLSGIEIAHIENHGEGIEDIIVAKVLETAKHPQADRLNVCKVNNGNETLQIVCGASNVRAGLTIALAPVGAKLPGGLEIKAAKIRGVDSFGMICSESELGLAKESEGILELPDALVVGQRFLDAVEVRDEIWELELTPDRSDCLSIMGMARELRRYFGEANHWPDLKQPERDEIEKDQQADVAVIRVEVQAPKACPLYGAQLFEGFSKTNYSRLLIDRLKVLGIERLHNPVVDLANYVLFELGHPTHTFDADEIVGAKIVVRFAKEGEKMTTIDGVERTLHPEDLIIADMEKPIALAGVMGSKESGVTEKTTRVVLESAFFDPEVVRATAKRHKIISDAAHRFERGVNPLGVIHAAGRLSALFKSQLGARRRGSFVLVKADKAEKLFDNRAINLDLRKVQRTLGFEIPSEKAMESLLCTGIHCHPKSSNVLTVEVPPYRWDLSREIDLVEEIARVYGYDKIPSRYPIQKKSFSGIATSLFDQIQVFRTVGVESNFVEVAPYAFISEQEKKNFAPTCDLQQLENPISEDWKYLRPSLLPGIVQNLSRHGSLRQKRVQIFEVGTAFEKTVGTPGLKEKQLKTKESLHFSWGLMGHREEETWLQDKTSTAREEYRGYFDAKSVWELLHQKLLKSDGRWKNIELVALWTLSDEDKKKIPSWIPLSALHPGRSALVSVPALRGYRGFVGELHPSLVSEVMNFPAGWKFPVALGEIRIYEDLWSWKSSQELSQKLGVKPRHQVQAPALTPVVERDLSFTVKSNVKHDEMVKVIKKSSPDLKELSCVDLYKKDSSDETFSITFRLLLQAQDRTLAEEDVQRNIDGVIKELSKLGATLR